MSSKKNANIKKVDLSGIISATEEELKTAVLFNDEEICTVARYPNKESDGSNSYWNDLCSKVDNHTIKPKFAYLKKRFDMYHSWDGAVIGGTLVWDFHVERCDVIGYDKETGHITMTPTCQDSLPDDTGYNSSKPFYVENIAAELDVAGEFYLDHKTGVLYVYEPEGDYELSYQHKNFIVTTDGASHITFRGFDFVATSGYETRSVGAAMILFPYLKCWEGLSDSAALYCAADSSYITVDQCSFSKISTQYTVFLDGYNMHFTSNLISNCAGGGIYSNCGDRRYRDELDDYKRLIDNNEICNIAQKYVTYHQAIYSFDAGAVISHNEIHDIPHFALEYAGVNTTFEYNVMYRCNLWVEDAGTVYAAQFNTRVGNVIRYNMFYDTSPRGIMIYLDNGVSGQTVYGNLFYSDTGSNEFIRMAGGRENCIYDNLLIKKGRCTGDFEFLLHINGKYYEMAANGAIDAGASTWNGGKHYTVYPPEGSKGEQIWMEKYPWVYSLDYDHHNYEDPNCAVNPTNSVVKDNFAFAIEGEGVHQVDDSIYKFGTFENNHIFSTSENPLFVDPTHGDYRIREDADISQTGKVPFVPVELMGRY